jgi:hypothetical protein
LSYFLHAEADPFARLGGDGVGEEAVLLGELMVPVRLDGPKVLQVDLVRY